jgi:hypothetical protein
MWGIQGDRDMSDDCCNVPAPAQWSTHFPDEIILYGVRLNRGRNYASFYAGYGQELRVEMFGSAGESFVVLAYGYAYEGHCYRFDKARVFVVRDPHEEDPIGCGFDIERRLGQPAVYRMWRIRAATQLLELTTNFDTARALILEANLPGRRAPSTYSITMQMAHRGGRLTRD